MQTETNLKIERIPHGMVLRDEHNAVFICKSDLRRLQSDIHHKTYNNVYKTFVTIEYAAGVAFIDIENGEGVRVSFRTLGRLL